MSEGKIFDVPVPIMAELLSAAASGFYNEAPDHKVLVTESDMQALRFFVIRGLTHHPEPEVAKEILTMLIVAGGGDL